MRATKKATVQGAVYAMCVRGYEGAIPDARFTFTAANDKEAYRMASQWASYQGMTYYTDETNQSRSDVVVRQASDRELGWPLHNDYLR